MSDQSAHACDMFYWLAGHRYSSLECIGLGERIGALCEDNFLDLMLILSIGDYCSEWDYQARVGRRRGLFLLKAAPATAMQQVHDGIPAIAATIKQAPNLRQGLRALRYDWRAIGSHWRQIEQQLKMVEGGKVPQQPMRSKL